MPGPGPGTDKSPYGFGGATAAPADASNTRAAFSGLMLVCFTFEAKPGKEAEFEKLLNNAEGGRAVARAMGATRNSLFLKGGRMVRVFEFPDGRAPVSLGELAKHDKGIEKFLRAIAPIIKDGFDLDQPGSLDAFNKRVAVPLAYDARP